MSAIHAFLIQYGLIVVYLGVIIEGESVVIAAGFLAHQGLMNPYFVFLAAFAGSITGDQALFFVGRYFGDSRFARKQLERPLFAKVLERIHRNQVVFILTFRFIYGVRTISPIAIGMARVNPLLYVALNVASAMAWAAIMTTIGYLFSQALERFAGKLHHDHKLIAAGLLLLGLLVVIGVVRSLLAQRRSRMSTDAPSA